MRRLLRRLRLVAPARKAIQTENISGALDPSMKVDSPERVAELYRFVRSTLARYEPGMDPLSPIRVSRRMTRTLGSYRPDKRQIAVSSRLLAFGEQSHVETVLLHETAHAITHHRNAKASSHGRLFKSVCRELGIEPNRFVNVPIREWSSRRRYVFTCAVCGESLVRKRLLRIARCECGARLEVQRVARVAVDAGGRVVRVEGYTSPRGG